MYRMMGAAALSLALIAWTLPNGAAQASEPESIKIRPSPVDSSGPASSSSAGQKGPLVPAAEGAGQTSSAPASPQQSERAKPAAADSTLPEPTPARPASDTPLDLAQPDVGLPQAFPVGPQPNGLPPGSALPGGLLPPGAQLGGLPPGGPIPGGHVPGTGPFGFANPGQGPVPQGGVVGIREKGCYHAIPQYYSPYQVRPLLPADAVGRNVRAVLTKMGISLVQPTSEKDLEMEKEAEKEKDDKEKDKEKDKDKEPIRDK